MGVSSVQYNTAALNPKKVFLELCVEFVLRFLTKLSLPMLSITFLFDLIEYIY